MDGSQYAQLSDVTPGSISHSDQRFSRLSVQSFKVGSAAVEIRVYQSNDFGASWTEYALAKIPNGERSAVESVSVDWPRDTLLAITITSQGGDYDGPISWCLS